MTTVLVTDLEGRILSSAGLPPGWKSPRRGVPFRSLIHPDDFDDELVAALAAGGVDRVQLECRVVTDEGEVRHALCFGKRLTPEDNYLLFALEDVTRLRVGAEIAATHALVDATTQLPTRALHDNRLHHALAVTAHEHVATGVLRLRARKRFTRPGAVEPVELDLAKRLTAALPASATVTRIGSCEFSVLLPNIPKGQADAEAASHRIRSALEPEHDVMIGWALAKPGEDVSAGELVRRSVLAMYRTRRPVARRPTRMERLRSRRHRRRGRRLPPPFRAGGLAALVLTVLGATTIFSAAPDIAPAIAATVDRVGILTGTPQPAMRWSETADSAGPARETTRQQPSGGPSPDRAATPAVSSAPAAIAAVPAVQAPNAKTPSTGSSAPSGGASPPPTVSGVQPTGSNSQATGSKPEAAASKDESSDSSRESTAPTDVTPQFNRSHSAPPVPPTQTEAEAARTATTEISRAWDEAASAVPAIPARPPAAAAERRIPHPLPERRTPPDPPPAPAAHVSTSPPAGGRADAAIREAGELVSAATRAKAAVTAANGAGAAQASHHGD